MEDKAVEDTVAKDKEDNDKLAIDKAAKDKEDNEKAAVDKAAKDKEDNEKIVEYKAAKDKEDSDKLAIFLNPVALRVHLYSSLCFRFLSKSFFLCRRLDFTSLIITIL